MERQSIKRMPVLFVGHGSPMNGIEDNEFMQAWKKVGASLPRPRAILSVSAHWETDGTKSTAMKDPRTIHDFYGFPKELYEQKYPAPGSPELAAEVIDLLKLPKANLDTTWGLDHGTWVVLKGLFPKADVPVVQLSLDIQKSPKEHYALAKGLRPLRDRGVLVLGSGNIVHNLGLLNWDGEAYDWAREFDAKVAEKIMSGDHDALVHYEKMGEPARLSIPTNEHYLPLLYVLALADTGERPKFFTEKIIYDSLSMRSVIIGD